MLITADLTAVSAVIEGFLITGGHANGDGNSSFFIAVRIFTILLAGGMYNETSSPSIVNMVFSGNSTNDGGGGMTNTTSSPSIVNTVFSGNIAGNAGGGMYNGYFFLTKHRQYGV